jgi:hypothetical protein
MPAGDGRTAVVRFGIRYEEAVLAWLDDTRGALLGEPTGSTPRRS